MTRLVGEARERDALGTRASGVDPSLPLALRAEWHSRGRLPHWEASEVPQSITFRLADSLPRAAVERELATKGTRARGPRAAGTVALRDAAARRARFEALLGAGYGECLLGRPKIAALVENALLYFDGTHYRLHAWRVMPNHVHVLVTPLAGFSLSSLLHSWKSFTAKAINLALARRGPVWFEDYFDRRIRDEAHYAAALAYIENNPVAAGLCSRITKWEFSSAADKPAERARLRGRLTGRAVG